jgi:single-stranded-DNA-specific exonuclease
MTRLVARVFDAAAAQRLAAAGLPAPLARALAARGVASISELTLLTRELLAPERLTQVQAAAQLLADAIAARRRQWAQKPTTWCPTASSTATG